MRTRIARVRYAGDETFPHERQGRLGLLIALDVGACGAISGETKEDPLHVLLFPGGERNAFWAEELEWVERSEP